MRVFTIGFGSNTDTLLLQRLARYTGGSYYPIYASADIKRVFKDVALRVGNFYSAIFKKVPPAAHELRITYCDPKREPTLVPLRGQVQLTDTVAVLAVDRYTSFKKKPVKGDLKYLDIHFDFDEATIKEESVPEIEKMLAYLKKYPQARVEIRGHTDAIGSQQHNQELSERRARALVNELISRGVSRNRMRSRGFNFSQPLAPNTTEEGRALNRRSEMLIIEE